MSNKKQHLHDDQRFTSETHKPLRNISGGEYDRGDELLYSKIEKLNNKIKDLEASITIATLQNKQDSDGLTIQNSVNRSIQKGYINPTSESLGDTKSIGTDFRFIGYNPTMSDECTINFLDSLNKDPRSELKAPVTPFGPLKFIILLRQDPGGILVWKYLTSPNRIHFSIESVFKKNPKNEDLERRSRQFYGDKYIKRLDKTYSDTDIIETKKAISNFGPKLGICFHPVVISNSTCLLEQIKQVLPDRRTLNILVDIFFENLFPFFPILDESAFRADIFRLVEINTSDKSNGEIRDIVLGSKHDLAFLATLLITLRLSYLSLFSYLIEKNEEFLKSEDSSMNSKNRRLLMEHPIPIEAINIAELCLKEFDLTTESCLALFQSLCIMHIYHKHAPEEDPSNNHQSTISIGILYQMANSLFLNRDPEYILHFSERKADERIDMLKRNLWYYLVCADIDDSIVFGSEIYTVESNYDTKKPFLSEDSSKISEIEKQTIIAFDKLYPVLMSAHGILALIFRVKSEMKFSDLAQRLTDFEILVEKTLGNMGTYLVSNNCYPEFFKIQKFKLYLYCKLMLLYIYYCFFLYFENRNVQLNIFYLKKLWTIVYDELGYSCDNFLYYCEGLFGSGFVLIVTPIFEYLTRMRMLFCQFRVRLTSTLRSISMHTFNKSLVKNSLIKLYSKSLNALINIISELEMSSESTMSNLSDRYFYAWKSFQSYRYGRNILDDHTLYEIDEESSSNANLKYSLDELQQLENLLRHVLGLMNYKSSGLINGRNGYGIHTRKIEECMLYDHQIDKLWFLYDLMRQESLSSRNGVSKYNKRKNLSFMENAHTNDANTRVTNEFDNHILHDNIFGNFAVDDFFSDNPFSLIS